MHPGEIIYETIVRAAPAALRVVAPLSGKVRRGLAGRGETLPSMRTWAGAHRDPDRPLVWLHAPSVGEGLMAQAILEAIRERAPHVQAAFTYFSPSAERIAPRTGADWYGYLPWDRTSDVRAALDALRPACIAFVRTEIWPVLGREARDRGAHVLLVNAVLGEGSSRLRRGARFLLGAAYRRLDAVGAVSQDDAARFKRLGTPAGRVSVTGDARFDQVRDRVRGIDPQRPLLRRLREGGRPVLVAGSTWPADEAHLVTALAALAGQGSPWRLVAAPHEPTPAHVAGLARRLAQAGLSHAILPVNDDDAMPATDALIVDRVGILAELYAAAHVAYVGGGFGGAGLHSVVEPAALGVPVLYGPHHGNAREAGELAVAGGGMVVGGGPTLRKALAGLLDVDARTGMGRAAREFVEARTGGASRNAELVIDRL
ncbi:MAG TPA: glycosyltransferase N-terminal domain-containing protein [Longimicrobiales bacterium]|nr:glycosyltransferase N-terminal domain-containing protein [Longimicrobiales bacterium]